MIDHSEGHDASGELSRVLFTESDDGLLIADASGRVVTVNDRSAELSGYCPDELCRLTLTDLVVLVAGDTPTRSIGERFGARQEGVLRRKDGTPLPVEVTDRTLSAGRRLVRLRDVSGLKVTQDSEWRFRSLVESAQDVIFISDEAGRFLYANPAGAATLGLTQRQIIGRTVEELFPPDVARRNLAGVQRVIRTGQTLVAEDRMEIDGRVTWFSSIVQPVRDRQGRVTAAQGLIRNITSVKEAEASLRESEERLRQVVRVAHIGIFDHDHLTGAIYWSPEQREIYGWPADEPVTFSSLSSSQARTFNLIHPDDRARAAEALRRAHSSDDGLFDIEYRIIRSDGSLRWLTTRSQTFFEGEGDRRHPIRTIGAVRDVTGIKNAEEALRESEERLRQATRVANIGIFDHDHRTGALYMSQTMREIIRVPPAAVVSGDDFAIADGRVPQFLSSVHPEDRERVSESYRRAHESGDGVYDVEYRHLWPDGAIQWVTVKSQTYFEGEGSSARPVRTVGAVRDVSARVEAQEEQSRLRDQLAQAQKMESIGRLAGGVAHDFNNMLNVIGGYAELALGLVDSTSPLFTPLHQIQDASRRSADLTRQLLAFARRQPVTPKVLDVNQSVDRALTLLRRLIGEDIQLAWLPGHLWPVRIDPAQIDQILVNLVVNARDAIAGHGNITVRTHNMTVDEAYLMEYPWSTPGPYVMLEVSDDGRGMDAETKAHIFEPFFTTKAEGRGVGLGLATVYGIVKQNSGLITVESDPGRGTTFRVLLPRVADAAVDSVASEEERVPTGSETLLLVEDEPMVLRLTARLLETLGYTVLTAATPGEAARIADQHAGKIQLLVTDIVMPETNGHVLAEQLRSRYPGLKCLFVSGYFPGAGRVSGASEGMQFLQKPFSRSELAAAVREALSAKSNP